MEQALSNLGVEAELVQIVAFLPAGETPASGLAPSGEMVFDVRVDIEVAADGSVTNCRNSETRYIRPLPGLVGLPNLCGTYRSGGRPAFQADRDNEGVRRGQVRSTLHLRTGAIVVDS